ncbi:hypothetical protein CTI12_AA480110 [Artemisia annua]|uniref:Uncharacterized protein n=1 Tax=Artemisia annua TaxID=35608 RepID=A0A2U1LLA0_ARTAN|nr:hypothetical protein CTI12_AA480110 [Artemisia annua]
MNVQFKPGPFPPAPFLIRSSLRKTKGAYIFTSKLVFDPGVKQVFDLGGSRDDAKFSSSSQQVVDCILDSISNILSKEKITESIKWITGSSSLRLVKKKMCHALQGEEAGQVYTEYQYLVQLLDFIHGSCSSTKFGMTKDKLFEKFLGFDFAKELMLVRNKCDEPLESVGRSCKCCCSQWSYIVVIEADWNRDNWPMKNGVNCVVVQSVQGVSQFNHPNSSQSMV